MSLVLLPIDLIRSTDSFAWQNNYDLVLESYSRIADGAQLLITGCCFIQDDATYGVFNGVQYFGGNWNVVVQHADC